jgi:hypothetical protein
VHPLDSFYGEFLGRLDMAEFPLLKARENVFHPRRSLEWGDELPEIEFRLRKMMAVIFRVDDSHVGSVNY